MGKVEVRVSRKGGRWPTYHRDGHCFDAVAVNILDAELITERMRCDPHLVIRALPESGEEEKPEVVPTCNATRKDGTPCTGKAVKGHDRCIAHLKK